MLKNVYCQIFILVSFVLVFSLGFAAQTISSIPYRSQEVSEVEGIPVLIKHLPGWDQLPQENIVFAVNKEDLKAAVGDRPVIESIDFVPGTEAVSAFYPAGRLVIVEFASPQSAADASYNILRTLDETGDTSTIYRRIGNYNALVLDASNKAEANELLDGIKYEKQIHWLGDNPFRISAERAFVLTTSDIFLSTVLFILIGIGIAIAGGLAVGIVYFQMRERRRAAMTTHTDAGGMTRLNLDGLTPDIVSSRLLND